MGNVDPALYQNICDGVYDLLPTRAFLSESMFALTMPKQIETLVLS
jgi:hypothetical protein